MRTLTTALLLGGLVLTSLGCAGTPPVAGSWEMIEAQGETLAIADPSLRPTKVLDDTHFAFGSQRPDGTVWAGGGRYEWDHGVYTEFIVYHSLPELVGLTAIFNDRIEGDLWYHAGLIRAGGRSVHVDEVWRRVGGHAGGRTGRGVFDDGRAGRRSPRGVPRIWPR